MNRIEVVEELINILKIILRISDGEITPSSRIFGDLGLESVEYCILINRIERGFGINFPPSALVIGEIIDFNPCVTYVNPEDWTIKPEGIKFLEERISPDINLSEFKQDPTISTLLDIVTVEMVADNILALWQKEQFRCL